MKSQNYILNVVSRNSNKMGYIHGIDLSHLNK